MKQTYLNRLLIYDIISIGNFILIFVFLKWINLQEPWKKSHRGKTWLLHTPYGLWTLVLLYASPSTELK